MNNSTNNSIYEDLIDNIPNFPKEGVTFKDVTPLLTTKLDEVVTDMGKGIDWDKVDLVVGVESRGFILGAAMAVKFNKGFLPIRKKGKLPPPTITEDYTLEYGVDTLEMRVNDSSTNIVLVDDVLATGGTLKAGANLCNRNNYHIQAVRMLINLKFLNNAESEYDNLQSLLNYE